MNEVLVLQTLLGDDTLWAVHNCKPTQVLCEQESSLTLLEHYQGLSEELKDSVALDFGLLQRMSETMTVETAATLLGCVPEVLKIPYKIKYIGRAVIFCEHLKIALRLHFSNTAKPAQTVFLPKADAIAQELCAWRAFGVIEMLYKGELPLVSVSDESNEWSLSSQSAYQPLPPEHSLAVLSLINEQRGLFWYLNEAITAKVAYALE